MNRIPILLFAGVFTVTTSLPGCSDSSKDGAREAELYRSLEADLAQAQELLYGSKVDREGGVRLLGEILKKAPSHPLP